MVKPLLLSVLCSAFGASPAPPSYQEWAATPPMGWNSWDAYGTAVREQDVKANADYMAAESEDGKARYFAVFNLGEKRGTLGAAWRELGMTRDPRSIRDLWRQQDLKAATGLKIGLAPHASAMFRVSLP
jgi:hypothetical protein